MIGSTVGNWIDNSIAEANSYRKIKRNIIADIWGHLRIDIVTGKLFPSHDTLEKLGFSVIKLEEYKSSYKLKYGVDPSVNAVADIARRLIAITEGNITDDILSEEVAHILTETYNNQDEIRNILPEVENTPEWAEFSDIYFKLYEGKGLSGEMLTEKVRREILGKIISTKILETATPETLLGRIQQIVNNFFSSIKRMLLPSVKSRLNNLVDIIAEIGRAHV